MANPKQPTTQPSSGLNILLIEPAADHLRVDGKHKVVKRKMLRFSVLSLTTVAALTPERHHVTLVDENVECLDFNLKPDVVGITFMTGLAPRAYELARHFRQQGAVTVAGGFHPTLNPEEVSQHFDVVAVGHAEDTWPRILVDIELLQVRSIYRSDPHLDLAAVPIPRRELLQQTRHHYITTHAVQTGRGCNHRCKFCSITAFYQHQYHCRPVEKVLDELKRIPRHFMFVDDNIIADRDYARRLFQAMRPLKKRWISQCSIELADDPELLDLAYQAGCRGVFIGIESIQDDNLTDMDKTFNQSSHYLDKIRTIRGRGIAVQAGMIVGLDADDRTVFQRNLAFLQKARIDALQLAILTPQPGTPLHDEFKQAGRITDFNWAHYDYRHTVIAPNQMTAQDLQDGADWLYRQFYRLDRIIIRALRCGLTVSPLSGLLSFRMGLTYRRSLRLEGRVGRNPARVPHISLKRPFKPEKAVRLQAG